ncbi:MAG TPA: ATP-binding cassette domain-containing protein [Thermoleophilaceae bacterium]
MLLSLEHVAKTHWVGPYEKRTLVDVSLSLGAGDFVGVWGAHRSGKSTLLRIAAGLELPDSGSVRFEGNDLAALSGSQRGELRLHELGVVRGEGPQSAELSVIDYVALPLLGKHARGEARRRAAIALKRVGITDCQDANWRHLSDGERALVSLAHALVRDPKLLLADDPTVRLDALQQAEVVGLLRSAATESGVSVLMTSSVMSALAGVHEAFTLDEGTLAPVVDPSLGADVLEFPRGGQMA